jgi:hypothetical protein
MRSQGQRATAGDQHQPPSYECGTATPPGTPDRITFHGTSPTDRLASRVPAHPSLRLTVRDEVCSSAEGALAVPETGGDGQL